MRLAPAASWESPITVESLDPERFPFSSQRKTARSKKLESWKRNSASRSAKSSQPGDSVPASHRTFGLVASRFGSISFVVAVGKAFITPPPSWAASPHASGDGVLLYVPVCVPCNDSSRADSVGAM